MNRQNFDKNNRVLAILYRAMKGELLNVQALANEYEVTTKTISRYLATIKNFLAENRELVGHTELQYNGQMKGYQLQFDSMLQNEELMVLIKILIGTRALRRNDLLRLVGKLKMLTTCRDRVLVEQLIKKELHRYVPVEHIGQDVIDMVWRLTRCIQSHTEITITYYKANMEKVNRTIQPVALLFSEYYFYLVGYWLNNEGTTDYVPILYRVDRIVGVKEHRRNFELTKDVDFDEGNLRNKVQFMHAGKPQKVKFTYTGDSLQSVLDRIPTATVLSLEEKTALIEAEVFGMGIKHYLLGQGRRVKVLEPPEFVEDMKTELQAMLKNY
ncbi:MAG: WYL domain-containing protein [Veillonella sp.]|uniref:helix-turn-helix transcriptional regulator n=1 Tax=Veillonella sp. TaxID=1926307 RepID=UPI0025E90508|nr:WYL domain-containing protein [Veillonella sp.]MBS4912914.1 WYL domain-containing protein [Veillonella sp.]